MRYSTFCSPAAALAVAIAAFSSPALAVFQNGSVSALASSGAMDTKGDSGSGPVTLNASSAGTPATGAATAGASVSTGQGGLHLQATSGADVYSGPGLLSGTSSAAGYVSDAFLLSVPQQWAGSTGTLTVAFAVSGSLQAAGSVSGASDGYGWEARSNWSANMTLSNSTHSAEKSAAGYLDYSRADLFAGGDQPGVWLLSMAVDFDKPVSVEIRAAVDSFASASNGLAQSISLHAGAGASFQNTMAWGGIVSLVDAQQRAVPVLSALSMEGNGYDYLKPYTAPVPELPAATLLPAGLALLAWRKAKRPLEPARGTAKSL